MIYKIDFLTNSTILYTMEISCSIEIDNTQNISNKYENHYKPEYGKKTHPADLSNTHSKNIMCSNEHQLEPIPENTKSLQEQLGYNEKQCVYCGEKLFHKYSIDEIIPCGKGGRMNKFNQVKSCITCNNSKNDKYEKELIYWIKYGIKGNLDKKTNIKSELLDFCKNNRLEIYKTIAQLKNQIYSYLLNSDEIINISSLNLEPSKIPIEKQKIVLDFINNNINYLKTNNPKILQHIQNIKQKNTDHLKAQEQESNKIIDL